MVRLRRRTDCWALFWSNDSSLVLAADFHCLSVRTNSFGVALAEDSIDASNVNPRVIGEQQQVSCSYPQLARKIDDPCPCHYISKPHEGDNSREAATTRRISWSAA